MKTLSLSLSNTWKYPSLSETMLLLPPAVTTVVLHLVTACTVTVIEEIQTQFFPLAGVCNSQTVQLRLGYFVLEKSLVILVK